MRASLLLLERYRHVERRRLRGPGLALTDDPDLDHHRVVGDAHVEEEPAGLVLRAALPPLRLLHPAGEAVLPLADVAVRPVRTGDFLRQELDLERPSHL